MLSYIESVLFWLKKNIRQLALPRSISNDKILKLPLTWYRGEIIVINTPHEAIYYVKELEKEKILGFDTESKPSFKKGEFHEPSLVQLATKDKVYLFQLKEIEGINHLIELFENKKILKIGVAVEHDITALNRISPFKACGFYDLGLLSQKLGIKYTGLRNLTGIFLKKRLSKSSQLSDWSQSTLTDKQKIYAATDAWISRLLYFRMKEFE